MKPELVLTRPLYLPAMAALDREYTVHRVWTAADPEAMLREVGAKVRGVVTTGCRRASKFTQVWALKEYPGMLAACHKLACR